MRGPLNEVVSLYESGEFATKKEMRQMQTIRKPFQMSLSVFFPCYNEEANVERTTLSAIMACERLVSDYEIIIVNDGSKDRTGEIADRLAAEHPRVRAVHNKPNRGYGGALQRGFREATKDWVFYTDGDGQFDFQELEQVLPMVELFDIVSAYRINRQDPWNRRLNAWCWGKLVDSLLHLKIRDVDCAFKVYPKSFIDQIELRSTGALIDTEMLAKARRLGYSIGQIGVHHYPRTAGQQTGANFRVILKAFKELFKLYGHIRTTARAEDRATEVQRVTPVAA